MFKNYHIVIFKDREGGMRNLKLRGWLSLALLLVFVAVAVTMTIGTLLGYVLTHLLYNGGAFYISFKFPTVFVLAYTLVLIAVPLLITLVSMHSFSKEALVERLRGMEN